jgi:15-cis-phytoene synthase
MIALRPLVLAYAPSNARADLSAVLDLDEALGRIVASTTEPIIGQMRLTWWRERLSALGREPVPAEPVLGALNETVARGVMRGEALVAMVEGWEVLLEPMPLNEVGLRNFAEHRGNGLFAVAANICGGSVERQLGAGWALIDFAMHCSDHGTAVKAIQIARDCFKESTISGPKPLRILAHMARIKANQSPESIREPISRFAILKAVLR